MSGHPTVITTEARLGQTRRLFVHVLNGVVVAALSFVALAHGVPFRGMGRGAAIVIAVVVGLGVVTFVLSPLLGKGETRGTWILERDTVTFAPAQGRTRTIRWRDVDRVRPRPGSIDLHGNGETLRLGSRLLDARQWAVLVSTARQRLDDRFVLTDRGLAMRPWYVTRALAFAGLALLSAWLYASAGLVWPTLAVLAIAILEWTAIAAISRRAGWQEAFVVENVAT